MNGAPHTPLRHASPDRSTQTATHRLLVRPTALLGLCLLAWACGGDDSSGPPKLEVKDKAGRECTIGAADEVSCDQDPMPSAGCPSGANACFQLSSTGDAAGPAAICAACCQGSTSTSVAVDCSEITCATDDDCPSTFGRCLNGACRY